MDPLAPAAMTCARWQEVKAVLAEALEYDSEVDRLVFLAASSHDDPDLRAKLDALLAFQDHTWCDDASLSGLRAVLLGFRVPAFEDRPPE